MQQVQTVPHNLQKRWCNLNILTLQLLMEKKKKSLLFPRKKDKGWQTNGTGGRWSILDISEKKPLRRQKGGQAHESQRLDSGRTADERTTNCYVSSLAGRGILDMKKRWTMKRIVDTLFVLVILGDIATLIMFVAISVKILKMQEVITWLIQQ